MGGRIKNIRMKPDVEEDLSAEPNPIETILDSVPEEERWDPVLGSQGKRKLIMHNDDDDEDGRPAGAVLVEAGVEAAEYDQMLHSERQSDPRDDALEPGDELTYVDTDELLKFAAPEITGHRADEISQGAIEEGNEDDTSTLARG